MVTISITDTFSDIRRAMNPAMVSVAILTVLVANACSGSPPTVQDTGGASSIAGATSFGGSATALGGSSSFAGGSATSGAGGAAGTLLCGGLIKGICQTGATCDCCPAGGIAQHCWCTTSCTSSSDCNNPSLPICELPPSGGNGFCRDDSQRCCWLCG